MKAGPFVGRCGGCGLRVVVWVVGVRPMRFLCIACRGLRRAEVLLAN